MIKIKTYACNIKCMVSSNADQRSALASLARPHCGLLTNRHRVLKAPAGCRAKYGIWNLRRLAEIQDGDIPAAGIALVTASFAAVARGAIILWRQDNDDTDKKGRRS